MRLPILIALACIPVQAFSDLQAGERKAQLCVLCHREAPDKRFVPLLDGQPADYLVASMVAFKSGQRKTSEPAMTVNLQNLSQADFRDIADYFASRPLPTTIYRLDPADIAAGDRIVAELKCASCHSPAFHGGGVTPRLAGQKPAYLVYQLEAFRDARRSHSPAMPLLKERSDMEKVAGYLASLP